jgi:hypothetical protein
VFDDEGYGFEYYYHAGKVNVVGAKGMTTKKGSVEVNFFDTDKKVKDFLNLSRVQFMARYKVTKDNYQKMVSAITRNIEGVFSHGGKMAGAGMFSDGGEMNEYDVVYNSYDQETGDMIADHESVSVMASSILEAKNKARMMLEEGSRDEDFTIVRVNDTDFGHRMMADGGMTNNYEGLMITIPSDVENKNGLIDMIESYVGDNYEDRGNKIFIRNVDIYGHGVDLSKLIDIHDYIESHRRDVDVELFAKGGMMAKGGLTNIQGNAPVSKYPEIKPEITIVE